MRHLLLSGGPGHPFATTAARLADVLAHVGFETVVVTEPNDAWSMLHDAHIGAGEPVDLVTVNALRWAMEQERYADQRASYAVTVGPGDLEPLDRFVRNGGGLLALHTAVICFDADPTWRALCGASWRWEHSTHPPLGAVTVDVTPAGRDHELTIGVEPFVIVDEAYGFLDELDDLEPLLTAEHGGRTHPVLWSRQVGDGRVVTDLLGHGPESFDHPDHRRILARAATWAVGRREPARPSSGRST